VDFAAVHTCTKEEWILYLANWNVQGMGPANGPHCALLQLHRSLGMVPSFLEQKCFWKMMHGASSNFKHRSKGVLDAEMQKSFESYLPFAEAIQTPCKCCEKVEHRLQLTVCAYRIMKTLHIRPGNLKDLEAGHVDMLTRQIWIPNWKTTKNGMHLPLTEEVMGIILEALQLSSNDFFFHRCVEKHLTAALREAESVFDWPRGLVFTVHCLRHTGMCNEVGKIEQAVKQLVANVTGRTFDHYSAPLEKRLRHS